MKIRYTQKVMYEIGKLPGGVEMAIRHAGTIEDVDDTAAKKLIDEDKAIPWGEDAPEKPKAKKGKGE